MRFSRMPEIRRGGNLRLFGLATVVVLVAAALIVYFTIGFGSHFSQAVSPQDLGGSSNTNLAASSPVRALPPAQVAQVAATSIPESALKTKEQNSTPQSPPIPAVNYGEVLSEGFVPLELPGGESSDSWYTFQVNISTRDITLFFALYNSGKDTIIKTVEIGQYSQGELIDNARVTMFYPNGAPRHLHFDAVAGTTSLSQRYGQPYGPSMFSSGLRVAMVNYGLVLGDESGAIRADVHLDLSGLSDSESVMLTQSNPDVVNRVMVELQVLVDQINAKRPIE